MWKMNGFELCLEVRKVRSKDTTARGSVAAGRLDLVGQSDTR